MATCWDMDSIIELFFSTSRFKKKEKKKVVAAGEQIEKAKPYLV